MSYLEDKMLFTSATETPRGSLVAIQAVPTNFYADVDPDMQVKVVYISHNFEVSKAKCVKQRLLQPKRQFAVPDRNAY